MPEWFSLTPIFQYKDRIFDISVRENPYFGIFDTMMVITKHLTSIHTTLFTFRYKINCKVPLQITQYLNSQNKIKQKKVMQRLSLLHNFIKLSRNSGSAQVRTLLAACRRFAMVRISDYYPGWK